MDWEGLAALANKALASLAKLLQAEDLHAADAHRLAFAMLGVAPLHHCQAGSLPRARVSLTLRLICGYLLRSLLPFLTCIYDTLLDLEGVDDPKTVIVCLHSLMRMATATS